MNYLWEVMVSARIQGISEGCIAFRKAKRYSPYMEVSCPCLNQAYVEAGGYTVVEVNPYYRFFDIFKELYHPQMTEYGQLRESLTNLIFHQLAESDAVSGMTKEEYYKKLLYHDFSSHLFGELMMEEMKLFDREEREIILSGLLRQYQTGSSFDIFKDMMEELIPDNIVYRNNDNFEEIMVFIGQKQEKKIEDKMDFLVQMFVDIPYHVELYYEYHFGIIGIEGTMEIEEIALC